MAASLSELDRGRLLQMHLDGKSCRQIALQLNVSKSSVNRMIMKYEATGSTSRAPGQGRKRSTTEREDRTITRYTRNNRFASAREIQRELALPNISTRTITNRIHEGLNFSSYWATKQPYINERNRQRRVTWAQDHLHWTPTDWEKVLWSDESPFVLRCNRRKKVWRAHNERFNPLVTQGTVKYDMKLMVWGCFSAHGVGRLYRIEGIMVKEDYQRILQHQMLPSAGALFPDGNFIFQEDNDPKHSSRLCRGYLTEQGVRRMEWPSQSPDLNPIENLWSILDVRMRERQPGNLDELFHIMIQTWNGLEVGLLTRLVHSMPRRCQAVIDANGYATKY